MASYNINDVEEIVVTLTDGSEMVYRTKGLEKFRKIMVASPAFGTPKPKAKPKSQLVEEDDDEEDTGETPIPQPRVAGKPPVVVPAAGYNSMGLNYAVSKGSPMDIARQMQSQAVKTPGTKLEFG